MHTTHINQFPRFARCFYAQFPLCGSPLPMSGKKTLHFFPIEFCPQNFTEAQYLWIYLVTIVYKYATDNTEVLQVIKSLERQQRTLG